MSDGWGACCRCGSIIYIEHNLEGKLCPVCSNLKFNGRAVFVGKLPPEFTHARLVQLRNEVPTDNFIKVCAHSILK